MHDKEKLVIAAAKRLARFEHGILTVTQDAPCGAEDQACRLMSDLQGAVNDLQGKEVKKRAEYLGLTSPCPFCWGIADTTTQPGGEEWSVICPDCGCQGPITFSEKEAIKLWNYGQMREEA